MRTASGIGLTIRLGDLTALEVDAIVNPANSRGAMGGGVAKAIRDRGGREIESEARARAPIGIGRAVLTTAGTLPCRHVLHAPTMVRAAERSSPERIRQATLAALNLADQRELERIAFPGMGTGVGKVPKAEAARAMIETIRGFPARHLKEIILVDRDPKMVEAWQHASAEGRDSLAHPRRIQKKPTGAPAKRSAVRPIRRRFPSS